MLSPEERALLIALQDRMIELLVEKKEACNRHDATAAAEMRAAIKRLKAECDLLRDAA